jgi:hypothetical protein
MPRGEKGKVTPLRDWTEQSYGIENGRAVSSLEGSGNMGNDAKGKGRQIPGGVEAMNKHGSADKGRKEFGGSNNIERRSPERHRD